MRLTLRTLLAYRDGVLSPGDREDLHRRIQQSQDAGNLLRRLESVTKQPQVLAPPVLGKGLGGDPNSIAEYLDDALQHAQVPELERICLVSDVQLAELAACHELLSSAMHTKVAVPTDLRNLALSVADPIQRGRLLEQRRNQVVAQPTGNRAAQVFRQDPAHAASEMSPKGHTVAVPVKVQAPMVTSGGESIRPQGLNLETSTLAQEVPEYLVGSSRGNWRIPLAIGGLVALLGILIWQSLGPWDRVAELFVASAPAKSTVAPTRPETGDATTSDDGEDADAGDVAPVDGQASSAADADDQAAGDTSEPGEDSSPTTDNPSPTDTDVGEVPPSPAESGTEKATPPAEGAADPDALTNPDTPMPSAVWLPKNDVEQQAVLLTTSGGELTRVGAGEPLSLGSQLLVPPNSRATLDLPGGCLWTTCGPSLLDLQNSTDGQAAVLHTTLCRALVRGGPDGNTVQMHTPLGNYTLELTDGSSLASVEVAYRPIQHGSVLDERAMRPILIVVAAEGSAKLRAVGADGVPTTNMTLDLGEGAAAVGADKLKKFRLQSIPTWYRATIERPIDALAAEDMHQALTAAAADQKTVADILAELRQQRRPETVALAVQISLLNGDWQSFVSGFLGDERMRSHWQPTIDLARQLLAMQPAIAPAVQQQFVDAHGADGELLFNLLCGLPEDQLAGDGLSSLVMLLDSEKLAERVLAIHQLQQLTQRNLGYQPQSPNRASIQQWRRELATNRLNIVPPVEPIWERVAR